MDRTFTKEDLKNAFDAIDVDKSGTISVKELSRVFHALEFPLSDSQLEDCLKTADVDGSGDLDFKEFLDLMGVEDKPSIDVRGIFDAIDKDGSGELNAAELKQAFAQMGEEMTMAQVNDLIKTIDVDGDGNVSYEEFSKLIAMLSSK